MMHNDGFSREQDENGHAVPSSFASNSWLVPFSDLMSLMLAFFVMIFSMTQLQTQAWKSIVSGLSDELSPGREQSILQIEKEARPFRVLEPKGIDLGYLETVIREKFRNNAVLANARVLSRQDRVIIALPAGMLFESEEARPAPGASAVLNAVGQSLSSIKNRVEIHVYCVEKERPALSGTAQFGSAWELSLSRAVTAKKLLAGSGLALSIIPVGHSITPIEGVLTEDVVELVIREMGA